MIRRFNEFVKHARAGALDLAKPLFAGDMHAAGVELAALLARAPDDVAARAVAALRPCLPPDALPCDLPADAAT